jgi:dipeptidyl aminopeptidase/acylaminoacyl peptidase
LRIKQGLLLQGEEDWNCPIEYACLLETHARRLGLSNVEFRYFARAGHAPVIEMFDQALEFFGRHAASPELSPGTNR